MARALASGAELERTVADALAAAREHLGLDALVAWRVDRDAAVVLARAGEAPDDAATALRVAGASAPVALAPSGLGLALGLAGEAHGALAAYAPPERLADPDLAAELAALAEVLGGRLAEERDRARERLALDLADVGFWEWDPATDAVWLSPRVSAIRGYPATAFAGTFASFLDRIDPADRAEAERAIRGAADGRPFELDYRLRRGDGSVRWVEATGRAVARVEGGPARVVGISRDATARREAQHARDLQQRWLATTLFSIGDAVIATDAAGRVSMMNPEAERLTGFGADEARGLPLVEVFRIVNETTRAPVENPVDKVLATGRIVGLANHTVLIAKDGSEVPIDDSAAPIRGEDGAIAGVVLVFRDVGEHRREEARRAFVAEATRLLAGAGLDTEKTLATIARLAVPEFADWCAIDLVRGETLERIEVAHRDPKKVKLAHELHLRYPPDPNAPHTSWSVVRTRESVLVEHIPDALLARSARDEHHLALLRGLGLRSYAIVPLATEDRVLGTVILVTSESRRPLDRADLRVAEELASAAAIALDNARLHAEVRQAVRVRDDLLAVVSHDLRNPLHVLRMRLHQMVRTRRTDPDPTLRRDVEAMQRATDQMTRLIDDLMDYARIETGGLSLDPGPVKVGAVLHEAIELLQPSAASRAVRIEGGLDGEDVEIVCDRTRILQALGNLGSNAVRFSPEGGVVRLTAIVAPKEVRFEVRDEGPGIAPEAVPRLFERYWSGGRRDGLGLGLYIARALVERHGGTIAVDTQPGAGSTFRFTLPRTRD